MHARSRRVVASLALLAAGVLGGGAVRASAAVAPAAERRHVHLERAE